MTDMTLVPAAQPEVAPGVQPLVYVGFGRRFGARAIDTAIHWIVTMATGLVVGVTIALLHAIGLASDAMFEHLQHVSSVWTTIGGLLGAMLYEVLCEGLFGSTAGKYMLGMVVLTEDGWPVRMKAALGRSLAIFIDGFFFGVVGYSAMKDSPRQQRYGDQWNRTVVVTRDSAAPAALRPASRFALVFVAAIAADVLVNAIGVLLP